MIQVKDDRPRPTQDAVSPAAGSPHLTDASRPVLCLVRDACPVAPGCTPRQSAPCDGIETRHAVKLEICNVLEAIADALPDAVNPGTCLWVAANLVPAIRDAQAFEEAVIYPAYERSAGPAEERRQSLRRLRAEHVEDEALAEELTEVLLGIGHGDEVDNPEALGFMLRTFFETTRRHIAFEREHVIPLVRSRSAADF